MSREQLIQDLKIYGEKFPDEEAICRHFLEFIQNHKDCFERSLAIGHVTGSAWVVNSKGDSVLLTHHRKLNIWVQLGGHADGNQDILEVALQEAREESGISTLKPISSEIFDVDIHLIPENAREKAHYHYDVRFAILAEDEDYHISAESHDLSWVPVKRVPEFSQEESMLRMAKKWMRQNQFILVA